ncbi:MULTISPECIES: hypothetical protein [Methylomonas]|uniref:hypothetical protein n=1 Tax=Methylomonas TaxID=416 RepID=UPI0012321063|nr:hypothetical protein [Methylomonas rhizoryzae]
MKTSLFDYDILIDQARALYAALHARRVAAADSELSRLESLFERAEARYQRRLNRCAICYRLRNHDCIREPGRKSVACLRNGQLQQAA